MSAATPVDSTPLPAATATSKTKPNDTTTKPEKKKRSKKKSKRQSRKPTLKTKVVVRRLPPNLPEEIFMNSVTPWITLDNVSYSLYVPGKLSKSKAKESVFSRAYFHLKTMEAVVAFHQGFDGHVFVDSRGVESRAVVEFAPYQRIPKETKAVDARQGTIDQDQDYLDFLESLKAEEQAQTELQNEPADGLTQIERLENRIAMVTAKTLAAEQANKPKTTPLLEHLRAQKAAQAAAKAKKRERKRAEKAAPKKESASDQWKAIQQQLEQPQGQATTPPTEGKKRRERNRKKKDVDGAKKASNRVGGADTASVSSSVSSATNASTATQSKPTRPAKELKPKTKEAKPARPPKEPRPPRQPKEGNTKSKKQGNKKGNGTESGTSTPKQAPPQVMKILGRQSPAPSKQNTTG